MIEEAITFTCNNKKLFGILHICDSNHKPETIVCMVNGGPQTRVGGHRLYTQTARFLCSNGINVLRFDYEGMGDSEGDLVGFKGAGPSLIAAIDFIKKRFHQKSKIILWSVCDGCTICLLYAETLAGQINGLIMCNPLAIDDEKDLANALLKHYYRRRLLQKTFWIRFTRLQINVFKELKNIFRHFFRIYIPEKLILKNKAQTEQSDLGHVIFKRLRIAEYPVWFIFSTEDIVGMQFRDLLNKQKYLHASIKQNIIKGADHTFTKSFMKQELFKTTLLALNSINQKDY